MVDHNPSETESKARGPETPEHHTYNARNISARGFLLAVMHDKDLPIGNRIKAASALLRIYGEHEFEPPRLKYIIGGIPSEALAGC